MLLGKIILIYLNFNLNETHFPFKIIAYLSRLFIKIGKKNWWNYILVIFF